MAAVVGVPDERVGQVPAALIQLKDGATAPTQAELDAHVRRQLPATAVPKHIRFVERLPHTASLKIDLAAVRETFASGPPRAP